MQLGGKDAVSRAEVGRGGSKHWHFVNEGLVVAGGNDSKIGGDARYDRVESSHGSSDTRAARCKSVAED